MLKFSLKKTLLVKVEKNVFSHLMRIKKKSFFLESAKLFGSKER